MLSARPPPRAVGGAAEFPSRGFAPGPVGLASAPRPRRCGPPAGSPPTPLTPAPLPPPVAAPPLPAALPPPACAIAAAGIAAMKAAVRIIALSFIRSSNVGVVSRDNDVAHSPFRLFVHARLKCALRQPGLNVLTVPKKEAAHWQRGFEDSPSRKTAKLARRRTGDSGGRRIATVEEPGAGSTFVARSGSFVRRRTLIVLYRRPRNADKQARGGRRYIPQFHIGPIGVCVQHGPKPPPL